MLLVVPSPKNELSNKSASLLFLHHRNYLIGKDTEKERLTSVKNSKTQFVQTVFILLSDARYFFERSSCRRQFPKEDISDQIHFCFSDRISAHFSESF